MQTVPKLFLCCSHALIHFLQYLGALLEKIRLIFNQLFQGGLLVLFLAVRLLSFIFNRRVIGANNTQALLIIQHFLSTSKRRW